jgi:hypothetical protein
MADNEYYDEVDEEAHARSAENRSVPSPESRDLWQSGDVSTDGTGPGIEDVLPAYNSFRVQALAEGQYADPQPVEGESVEDRDERVADAAAEAQKEVDQARERGGYQAETGEAAGRFDGEETEDAVPDENRNEPKEEEDLTVRQQAVRDQAQADEEDDGLEKEGTVRSNKRRSKASSNKDGEEKGE